MMRAWRNGRRARLRIWSREGWELKSHRAHHSQNEPLTTAGLNRVACIIVDRFLAPFDSGWRETDRDANNRVCLGFARFWLFLIRRTTHLLELRTKSAV